MFGRFFHQKRYFSVCAVRMRTLFLPNCHFSHVEPCQNYVSCDMAHTYHKRQVDAPNHSVYCLSKQLLIIGKKSTEIPGISVISKKRPVEVSSLIRNWREGLSLNGEEGFGALGSARSTGLRGPVSHRPAAEKASAIQAGREGPERKRFLFPPPLPCREVCFQKLLCCAGELMGLRHSCPA